MTPDTAPCPVCGRTIQLRKDGRIGWHAGERATPNPGGTPRGNRHGNCPGWGRYPRIEDPR